MMAGSVDLSGIGPGICMLSLFLLPGFECVSAFATRLEGLRKREAQ